MYKNEIRTLSNATHKINSKWVKDLNISPDTMKHLEENIRRMLLDINRRNVLLEPPPRIMT